MSWDHWIHWRWRESLGKKTPPPGHLVPYPMVAALGLAGECGEVMEHLKKHYRNGKHPGDALLLEMGDLLHYLTVLGLAYGWTLADMQAANIDKLTRRDAGENV